MTTDDLHLLRRLHQHRRWVNENLLQAATGLSDEQLRQPFTIGQGSIWQSLLHMYAAEYVWLAALEGDDNPITPGDIRGKLPGNQLGEGPMASLRELQQNWAALETRWQSYLDDLSPAALDVTVYKISLSIQSGQRLGTRASDVHLHVCLHAHYTAAQTVNMLRQCGLKELPSTMMIALARQESR